MKKTLVAIALMSTASSAMAIDFNPGTITTRNATPASFTYIVNPADRKFVKNSFEFTLSANVLMNAGEEADGRFMAVATGSTQGRNIYVGHSNGGSVSGCGDPLTRDEANPSGAMADAVAARFSMVADDGCTPP